jgi:hypothetical protein
MIKWMRMINSNSRTTHCAATLMPPQADSVMWICEANTLFWVVRLYDSPAHFLAIHRYHIQARMTNKSCILNHHTSWLWKLHQDRGKERKRLLTSIFLPMTV